MGALPHYPPRERPCDTLESSSPSTEPGQLQAGRCPTVFGRTHQRGTRRMELRRGLGTGDRNMPQLRFERGVSSHTLSRSLGAQESSKRASPAMSLGVSPTGCNRVQSTAL
jgi:hypothetical protein